MTKKTVDDLFEQVDSRYSLVNAIARRARDIATEAEVKKETLDEKPVIMVLDDLLDGSAKIVDVRDLPEDDFLFFED